ncbi:DUF1697 domain-containing protein [Microlunatus antarcticus]|uniref:Uncharacterized protein (DUF1697 family) n=1 Tax=Microlunatus antarcticus TaxID=53388 RepID=A0A7W5JWH2_9ACTN|nr:uncharacterized protein (DUF1697 family) [Microlunatus antarcticus]
MTTYVALLRGVNLGPHRAVAMPRLAELARGLGYDDVWTWVNSGNLVLTTPRAAATVEREVADALEREYGTRIDVTVRSADELAALLGENPFPEGSPSRVTVAFLTGPAPYGLEGRIAAVATDAEPFVVADREVWVLYGDGIAGSRLATGFIRTVGVSATTRTLGTVTRVVAKIRTRAG